MTDTQEKGWEKEFEEKFGVSPHSIGWRDDDMTVKMVGDFISLAIARAEKETIERIIHRITGLVESEYPECGAFANRLCGEIESLLAEQRTKLDSLVKEDHD